LEIRSNFVRRFRIYRSTEIRDFYTAIGPSHVVSRVLMVFRRARRSCVQRAVIYGPLATILYVHTSSTRDTHSRYQVSMGENRSDQAIRDTSSYNDEPFLFIVNSFVPIAVIASCGLLSFSREHHGG